MPGDEGIDNDVEMVSGSVEYSTDPAATTGDVWYEPGAFLHDIDEIWKVMTRGRTLDLHQGSTPKNMIWKFSDHVAKKGPAATGWQRWMVSRPRPTPLPIG